jgi:hypothetical protein
LAKKFGEKNGVFCANYVPLVLCKTIDHHNIDFCEKRHFVSRKLAKMAENCDHNIDPWLIKKALLSARLPKVTIGYFILLCFCCA